MSQVDELIAELCPDGVMFKRLGDVGTFIRGSGLQKSDLTESGVPAIHYGQIHTFYGTWATKTKSFVSPTLALRLRHAEPGDLVIATTSEDDEAVGKATAWLGSTSAAVSGDAYIYRHTLEPRFVAYFLQTRQFQEQKKSSITGTKVRRISGDSLAKIRIPVPPLAIQHEIVRILDSFSELVAELKKILNLERLLRREQYEHYRHLLLSETSNSIDFDNQGACQLRHRRPLHELITYQQPGPFLVSSEVYSNSFSTPVLTAGKTFILGYTDEVEGICSASEADPVIIFDDFTTSFQWVDFPFKVKSSAMKLLRPRARAEVSLRYLFYAMHTINYSPRDHARQWIGTYSRFLVPVPPLVEQERIASILDRFDAAANDLSVALSAELAARRTQYEYYRDRLLAFQERPA